MRPAVRGWLLALGLLAAVAMPSDTPPAGAQSAEVAAAIHSAAAEHGVSEAWLRRVAWCESRYTPWVTSRGGHQGLFQFAPSTYRWMSWQAGYGGTSPYDPWSAAQVAAWAFRHGYASHWACR